MISVSTNDLLIAPKPDWDYWLDIPAPRIWECVILAFDFEPRSVSNSNDDGSPRYWFGGLDSYIQALTQKAAAHTEAGGGLHVFVTVRNFEVYRWSQVPLVPFGEWVISRLPKGLSLPDQFPRVAPLQSDKPAPAAPIATWELTKPQRDDGLALPLYDVLEAARAAGMLRPTAREAMQALRNHANVLEVLSDEVKFYDSKGEVSTADLESIRKRIERMTRR